MEPIQKVSNYLVDNAETIIRDITDTALENLSIKLTQEELEHAIQKTYSFWYCCLNPCKILKSQLKKY